MVLNRFYYMRAIFKSLHLDNRTSKPSPTIPELERPCFRIGTEKVEAKTEKAAPSPSNDSSGDNETSVIRSPVIMKTGRFQSMDLKPQAECWFWRKTMKNASISYCKEEVQIPIYEKELLTLNEAAALYNIGVNKIRKLTNDDNCSYVLFVGSKRLIKRRQFNLYLSEAYSI